MHLDTGAAGERTRGHPHAGPARVTRSDTGHTTRSRPMLRSAFRLLPQKLPTHAREGAERVLTIRIKPR